MEDRHCTARSDSVTPPGTRDALSTDEAGAQLTAALDRYLEAWARRTAALLSDGAARRL